MRELVATQKRKRENRMMTGKPLKFKHGVLFF